MKRTALAAAVMLAVVSFTPGTVGGGGAAQAAAADPYAFAGDTDLYRPVDLPADDIPGRVIASQNVPNVPGLSGSGWFFTNPYRTATQLKFVTTDTHGEKVAAVNTVFTPVNPKPGVERILSVQFAEDSVARSCAPSWQMRKGGDLSASMHLPLVKWGLDQGWTVVVPDHEGLDAQFLAGPMEGHAVLDSIRATKNELGYAPGTKVATMGYSGGGNASAWANALQPSYAGDIDLVAATAGGVAADLGAYLKRADSEQSMWGMAMTGAVGVARAIPSMNLDAQLNDRGRQLAAQIENNTWGCFLTLGSALDIGYWDLLFQPMSTAMTTSASMDALVAKPEVKAALDTVNLNVAADQGYRPTAPMRYWVGTSDSFVYPEFKTLMGKYGARNGTDYKEGWFLDHGGVIGLWASDTMGFVSQQLG